MRLGFLGGTFDPPHLGHLAIAQAAADRFSLDHVLLAPTGLQPLKLDHPTAGYEDRLHMLELLCAGDDRLEASRVDRPRADNAPNYTIDTLTYLHRFFPTDTLYNIVGADAFRDLPRWKDPQQLLTLCDWIIVNRPGLDTTQLIQQAAPASIPPHTHLHLLTEISNPASATEIRQRLANQQSCEGLLPTSIITYIQKHNLYAPAPR